MIPRYRSTAPFSHTDCGNCRNLVIFVASDVTRNGRRRKGEMAVALSAGTLRKRYALRSVAILLALLGAATFVLEPHGFVIRSFGLFALLASVQLVRMSRAQGPSFGQLGLAGSNRPRRIMWFVGFALLLLAGFPFWLLYIDALHGGHAVWPVHVFGGVALACAGVWGLHRRELERA